MRDRQRPRMHRPKWPPSAANSAAAMSAPRLDLSLQTCPLPLGIAVSGGSDSLALLLMAHETFGAAQIRAATVDHGLRDSAAGEIAAVREACAARGVAHETLRVEVARSGNLQAGARKARLDALSAWGRAQGCAAIALGHTQDDQAETVLMRLARGSGVDGLGAMEPQSAHNGMRLLRPLLGARRADLRAYLASKGAGWSEDPSNEDKSFARIAWRRAAPQLEALGLSAARLSETATWMQAARAVLEDAAQMWISAHAQADHGDAVLDLAALTAARTETRYRVLSRILCAVSGAPYRPRFAALERLELARASTLHGCLIYPHKGALRITREYSAVRSAPDPRWSVTGARGEMRALGETGLSHLPDWRSTALVPRRSLLASPSLWAGQSLIAAPLARPEPGITAKMPEPLGQPLHLPK